MEQSVEKTIKKIEAFGRMLECHGFSFDYQLKGDETEEETLEVMTDALLRVSTMLAEIFHHSPESIYVADRTGTTVAVNNAFEHIVGVSPQEVVGKSVYDLEKQGFFRPSIIRLVREEGRPMSIIQVGRHGEEILVTGVPIFDANDNLDLLVSNARLIKEISGLYTYVSEKNKSAEQKSSTQNKLILQSEPMKAIEQLVYNIKDTDVTVLITGASGVGKGVLARHIHDISDRSDKPLVEINCGAIPENLMESELFGYTGGAFTGANAKGKEGLIESAEGGTLFLDEIGEMPLALQVKLLKVLQDKRVQRIGATESSDVDVRVIAATNRDLKEQVRQGTFREDLFYRLHVIPIEIPPLKERQEDILEAISYFCEKYSQKYNRDIECTKEFVQAVLSYDWPGNIRELENYIERAVITAKNGILRAEPEENLESIPYDDLLDVDEPKTYEYKHYMEAVEAKLIQKFYDKHRSSYKVAEELGISQSKAYRLIRKYCIDQ